MIDEELLAAWQSLCDRAAPGPWELVDNDNGDPALSTSNGVLFDGTTIATKEDAAFVSAARSALPLLLAEVRQRSKQER